MQKICVFFPDCEQFLDLTKRNFVEMFLETVQASVIAQGRDHRDVGNIKILIQPVLFGGCLTPSL